VKAGWVYFGALVAALAIVFTWERERSIDFRAYYIALRMHAETGAPPYQPWYGSPLTSRGTPLAVYARETDDGAPMPVLEFLYPPPAVLILRPFVTIAPYYAAILTWRWLNLAVAVPLVLAMVTVTRRAPRAAAAIAALLLLVAYAPLRDALWLGQAGALVSAMLFAAFWLLTRGRGLGAGALLGLAAAIKVYPLFWIPMLLLFPGQRGRFVVGAAAALGGLSMVSLAVFGIEFWAAYIDRVLLPLAARPPGGSVSLYPYFGADMACAKYFNPLFFLGLLAALSTWLYLVRERSVGDKLNALILFSGVLFLVMPHAWEHYLGLLGILLVARFLAWYVEESPRAWPLGVVPILVYALTGYHWPLDAAPYVDGVAIVRAGLVACIAVPFTAAREPNAGEAD